MSAVTSSLEAVVGSSPDLAVARSGNRTFCRPLHRQYALHQGKFLRQHTCSASGFGTQRTAASTSSTEPLSDLNRLSDRALRIMLASNEKEASQLAVELTSLREMLLEERQDLQGSKYVKVLQGLLHHTLFKEADELDGQWKRAFDQIANQVAGCDWSVTEPGKTSGAPPEEPRFSTWDEALSNKQQASSAASASGSPAVVDETLYRRLGVSVIAPPAGLKAAYRREALKTHPDVNDAPDAEQRFAELSEAYDILSDPETRSIYDKQGLEGLKRAKGGPSAGHGNASKAWDEFKPFTKSSKRTEARSSSAQVADAGLEERPADSLPVMGDVVEYPLRELERDGRDKGVGLLVGRNMDRGDAASLPAETLDLCEIEPLRQAEEGSTRWLPDELGNVSFARLSELTVLPVTDYDGRFDKWTINVPLSEGCSGPALPEEIML